MICSQLRIESVPVCNSSWISINVSDHHYRVVLSCVVEFRGSWAPVMRWRRNDDPGILTSGVENRTIFNDSVASTLTLFVNESDDGDNYSCTTEFLESMKLSNTHANNTPEYNHTWKYQLLHKISIISSELCGCHCR